MVKSLQFRVFWLTFGLIILNWTSIKIVLPILPGLSNVFHCSPEGVKLSVSIYLIMYACIQPVWGGFVQRFGCRKTVFYSFSIIIIGSVIAMTSQNLSMYIIGRSMEGIGMGAASPVARTLLVNVYNKKELSLRIGIISGIAATMPAVTPIIGGYLMNWIDWRAIFGFLLLLSVAYLFLVHHWLPKAGILKTGEDKTSLGSIFRSYFSILKNKNYWGYTIVYSASMGGILGYYSAMPYWYITQLGIADHLFSFLAVPTVIMYIIGITIAGIIIKKIPLEKIIFYGTIMACITTVIAFIMAFMNLSGLVTIVIVMSLFGFAAGLITPNANAGVLSRFREVAAPASALVSVVIFSTASFTSAITMNLRIKDTIWPLVFYIGILSIISLLAGYFWVWKPFRKL